MNPLQKTMFFPAPWKKITRWGKDCVGVKIEGWDEEEPIIIFHWNDYPEYSIWYDLVKRYSANINLVVTAPEMYKVLEDVRELLVEMCFSGKNKQVGPLCDQIETVLRKARGGTETDTTEAHQSSETGSPRDSGRQPR